MPTSTCPVPVCKDSRLTTAASIIGILTFVYGALAGILVAWLQAMTIESELRELLDSFESTVRQLATCDRKLHDFGYNFLPSRADDELLQQLADLMERGHQTMEQMKKMVHRIGIFNRYSKMRRLRSIVAGKALKDTMDGLVKKAQRILSEVQLGMIQFKQDVINADQIARSKELFQMLLDPEKRPDADEMERSYALVKKLRDATKRPSYAEKSSRPDSTESPRDRRPSSQGPSPDFEEEDVLSTMTRPKSQTTDEEQIPHRAEEERSTAILRNQIQQAEARRSVVGTDDHRDADPLGTLMRARTMSIVPNEIEKQIVEESSEEIYPS